MAETSTPPECPTTVTVRRNPPRRARPTPATSDRTTFTSATDSSVMKKDVPSFPTEEILSMDMEKISSPKPKIDQLKVFLRVKPLNVTQSFRGSTKSSNLKSSMPKNTWPKPKSIKERGIETGKVKTKNYSCITANDAHSVSVLMPSDTNRVKSEVYNGFSHVFTDDSSQDEVYNKMMKPIVDEFINGRSGLLAALGPTGSGKTYTVFGTPREPGMVPRALRDIFRPAKGSHSVSPRMFYISMFEIYLEKGKTEKLLDLSPDGVEVSMQHSTLKGLKEMLATDSTQAESLVARGMLKRSTAMTNSNSQSSRSQCIINIRGATNVPDGETDLQPNGALLTFVDLAGAEREKKTGNQGGRLLESNFINNTSMVFGLCLRSLLEHQKNPKKPLQKHFQSSMLTRYLRDYLEGRKRMALILTIRSGKEDYVETSFLLRQASPYMEIKFQNKEDTNNAPCSKRQGQIMVRSRLPKRPKLGGPDACMDENGDVTRDCNSNTSKGIVLDPSQAAEPSEIKKHAGEESSSTDAKSKREYCILLGVAKALFNVLKQHKERVKVLESEVNLLKDNLESERMRYSELERELSEFKLQCSCYNPLLGEDGSAVVSESSLSSSEETANVDAETSYTTVSVEPGLTLPEHEQHGNVGRGSISCALVECAEQYKSSKTGFSTKVSCAEFDESIRSLCYKSVQVEDACATEFGSTISSSRETANIVAKTSWMSGSEELGVLSAAISDPMISSSQATTNDVAKTILMSGSDEPGVSPAAVSDSSFSTQETTNVVAAANQMNGSDGAGVSPADISDSTISSSDKTSNGSETSLISGSVKPGVSPAAISDSTIRSSEETANIIAKTSRVSGSEGPRVSPASISNFTISAPEEIANDISENTRMSRSNEPEVSCAAISDSTINSSQETANVVAKMTQMSGPNKSEVSLAVIHDSNVLSSQETGNVIAKASWRTISEESESMQCKFTSLDSKIYSAVGSKKQCSASSTGFGKINEFISSNSEGNERALQEVQPQGDSQCSNTKAHSSLQERVSSGSLCGESRSDVLLGHASINLDVGTLCTRVESLSSHGDVVDAYNREGLEEGDSYPNRGPGDTLVISNSQNYVKSGSSRPVCGKEMRDEEKTENVLSDAEANKLLKPERPRRRLMPASSVLLRDINSIGFRDDSEKHTGGRGGRKTTQEDNRRTLASSSLIRLLQKNKASR